MKHKFGIIDTQRLPDDLSGEIKGYVTSLPNIPIITDLERTRSRRFNVNILNVLRKVCRYKATNKQTREDKLIALSKIYKSYLQITIGDINFTEHPDTVGGREAGMVSFIAEIFHLMTEENVNNLILDVCKNDPIAVCNLLNRQFSAWVEDDDF